MKKVLVVAVAVVGLGLISVASAVAEGQGPPQGPFENSEGTWLCGAEANLPPYHCINVKSKGNTGVIKVFYPDPRWPQEGVSTDPKADSRPCPHDPDSPDGTWWSPVPGLYVCHHRP